MNSFKWWLEVLSALVTIFGLPWAFYAFRRDMHQRFCDDWAAKFERAHFEFIPNQNIRPVVSIMKRCFWLLYSGLASKRSAANETIKIAVEGIERNGETFFGAQTIAERCWIEAQVELDLELLDGEII